MFLLVFSHKERGTKAVNNDEKRSAKEHNKIENANGKMLMKWSIKEAGECGFVF